VNDFQGDREIAPTIHDPCRAIYADIVRATLAVALAVKQYLYHHFTITDIINFQPG